MWDFVINNSKTIFSCSSRQGVYEVVVAMYKEWATIVELEVSYMRPECKYRDYDIYVSAVF